MITIHMKPEKGDTTGKYFITGLGKFYFNSEADANSALALARAVENAVLAKVKQDIKNFTAGI